MIIPQQTQKTRPKNPAVIIIKASTAAPIMQTHGIFFHRHKIKIALMTNDAGEFLDADRLLLLQQGGQTGSLLNFFKCAADIEKINAL